MDKKSHWFSLVKACEEGQIPQKQFCKDHQLAYSTFAYWRRKYLRSLFPEDADPSGRFIPVDVQGHGSMELVYPNGVRLQVPPGIPVSQLSALIRLY